jgi:hypothetical protein
MKAAPLLLALTVLLSLNPRGLHAQVSTAVPFLSLDASTEGNGMGGISTGIVSDHPAAMIANPAQLGVFTLDHYGAASMPAPVTDWVPRLTGATFNVAAVTAGMRIDTLLHLPFPCSAGIGYAREKFDMGDFDRRDETNQWLGTWHSEEVSNGFSLGVSADYYVRVGLGCTVKAVSSTFEQIAPAGETGSATANIAAFDWGLLAELPLVRLVERLADSRVSLLSSLVPVANLSFGCSVSNIGGEVTYIDEAQKDPLPRMARMGAGFELGAVATVHGRPWKVIGLTFAREADDQLIASRTVSRINYMSGFGDISFLKNVIGGGLGATVNLRKGWELNFAECIILRGGSYSSGGGNLYDTEGYGIRLAGLMHIVDAMAPSMFASPALAFLRDHVDLRYDHASYLNYSMLSGTTFSALTVVIR